MTHLRIRHETTYLYGAPVSFGEWRLRMRPADTHGLRVSEASLDLTPKGYTRWAFDAYGNSVCHFMPEAASARLQAINHLLVERFPAPLVSFSARGLSASTPIYDPATRLALAPLITPSSDDANQTTLAWLAAHAHAEGEPALDYVMRLSAAIHSAFKYLARDERGTQTPTTTIQSGAGACRDLAWLMVETLRRLGFAARFVSGYIYTGQGLVGGGATHAWCEVFVPDSGWIECDPTNGVIESADLVRVAGTRTPQEASPMEGVVLGQAPHPQLLVDVRVTREPAD
ncbi:MAG: transglutaminase family protein [Pseudomonadota bacterium]